MGQEYKNCYICITKILFIWGNIYGLTALTATCNHKCKETTFVIKKNRFLEFLTYFAATFTLLTSTLKIIHTLQSKDIEKDLIFYSKLFTDWGICNLFVLNLYFFLWHNNYRVQQLDCVMNLLQNGRYYAIGTLLNKENSKRIYRKTLIYTILLINLIGFFIFDFFWTLEQFDLLTFLHRICICTAIMSYFIFMALISTELHIYVLMFNSCYDKVKIILENNINYQNINYINGYNIWNVKIVNNRNNNNNDNADTNAKYESLLESLIKICKLHLAIQDNLFVYCKFLRHASTLSVPGLIALLILLLYTTIKIVLWEKYKNLDWDFCVLLLFAYGITSSFSFMLKSVDSLRKPVRFFFVCNNIHSILA